MRYGHVSNGVVDEGPCSLPKAWENISGLNNMSESQLRDLGWLPWVFVETPVGANQVISGSTIVIGSTQITETQTVRNLSQQEIDDIKKQQNDAQTATRHKAYIAESDPLFFKWQRGEGTQQEWLDKVAEIKARFPKA